MRSNRSAIARAIAAAGLFLLLSAPATFAWSQILNNFPNSPTSCTNVSPYWCEAWPVNSNGSSVTVYFYRDPSLSGSSGENMATDVDNSAAQWNAAPAKNPFLYGNLNGASDTVTVQMANIDPYGCTWGETIDYTGSNVHVITGADTYFNSVVTWNHSYTYACGEADSRKVATHELGHIEALGHTSYTAVMHQGAESFWTPQTNDIQGLQAIYGAS